MRVCMVAYSFYEIDNRIMRYAEALADRGDHVDVLCLMRNGSPSVEKMNGVNVYRIQKRERNERRKISYLGRMISFFVRSAYYLAKKSFQQPYDLIHVHSVPDIPPHPLLYVHDAPLVLE